MVSRVLGFMRDILIAAVLGSGAVADAFFVAFRFPNLFRRLFGEGAFNAAFVPLFAKRLEGEGEGAARRFAEEALAALAFVLVGFSALAMLAMPWLMVLLAPGFVADTEKYDLAVLLTQIAFPYLLCMSIVALLSGVLNSVHHFWAAAAAPILLNLVLITAIGAAGWLGLHRQPQAGVMLAWGVFAAGLAQLALLWAAVRRAGFTLRLRRPRMTEGVKRLVALGMPGLVAGGITQINIVIGTIIASLQAGAVSYLYYADRLYQLPLGIVGVAIGVVLLPDLARKLKAGEEAAALESQNRSLELGLLLTAPAAVALAVAADPMIRVLFERGAFGASDTAATATALAAFAVGLPSFVLIKVFQPAYFAREDTATPMRFAAVNMAANALGSGVLFLLFREMGLMGHVGIALATSLAGWLNAALLWWELCRRGHFKVDARLREAVPLILVSSLIMGVALGLAGAYLEPWFGSPNPLAVRAGALGVLVALGAIVYFLFAHLTGAARLSSLREALRRQ